MWSTIPFALLALLALFSPLPASAERTPLQVSLEAVGYQPISNPVGLVVYRDLSSPIVRIAAEGWLPGPPRRLRDALLDYERQAGRIGRVVESRVLARGPGWIRVYQRLDLPVVADRDYTLMVRWGEDHQVSWISYRAMESGGAPERPGVVRVSNLHGSWQLRAVVGGGGTFVRFQNTVDVAGSVPRWMARSEAGKEVPELFGSVCSLAQRPEESVRTCSAVGRK